MRSTNSTRRRLVADYLAGNSLGHVTVRHAVRLLVVRCHLSSVRSSYSHHSLTQFIRSL